MHRLMTLRATSSTVKRVALWTLVSSSTLAAFALAPPLGSGAIHRVTTSQPSCAVRNDFAIDVVPVASRGEGRSQTLLLGVDAESLAPGALRSTFAYALHDDVGTLVRTGESERTTAVRSKGRLAGELSIPQGLAPGHYRLAVIGVGLGDDARGHASSKDLHFEVSTDGSIIPMPVEEWRMKSRYNVGRASVGRYANELPIAIDDPRAADDAVGETR